MPWSQAFPSLCCVHSSEGTAACLVANLSGRVWLRGHDVLSLLSKVPLSHMGSLLWTLSLDSATASWLICSPFNSHHHGFHGGLPPCPSPVGHLRISLLFSSLLYRILYLIFPGSDHLPEYSAPSNAEVLQSTYNAILPDKRDLQCGRDVVLVLFKCVQAPAFMPWISEPLKENTEALKPQKFMSSWEVVGSTFWFIAEKIKFGAMLKIQLAGCRSQFSSWGYCLCTFSLSSSIAGVPAANLWISSSAWVSPKVLKYLRFFFHSGARFIDTKWAASFFS